MCATAAPTPRHTIFPPINFHGVPQQRPGPWEYNITTTNDTVISPDVPHPYEQGGNVDHSASVLEKRNENVNNLVDFTRFKAEEMEELKVESRRSFDRGEEKTKEEEEEQPIMLGAPVSLPARIGHEARGKIAKRGDEEEATVMRDTPISFPRGEGDQQ
ncbi:hypothetical protein E4T43_08775 [Aureobasidium subglaciale]|nr:hypothetical protein E4T43_08775 [Aureobasidium subglaciale]